MGWEEIEWWGKNTKNEMQTDPSPDIQTEAPALNPNGVFISWYTFGAQGKK